MNHLATIWSSPRATIRDVLDGKAMNLFLPLAATYGIVDNLHSIMDHDVDPMSGATVLGVVFANFAFGAVSGIFLYIVFSYLLAGTGRLFGGNPSAGAARTVLAWASVPYLPLLAVITPLMLFEGDVLIFYSQQDVFRGLAGPGLQLFSLIYFLARGTMGIWAVVIAVVGLSEAFGISMGKSFSVLLLAGIVMVVLMIGAVLLLGLIGIL